MDIKSQAMLLFKKNVFYLTFNFIFFFIKYFIINY
nr:MAG TPA: hypothetical protein [Caudoviricetes sp.]